MTIAVRSAALSGISDGLTGTNLTVTMPSSIVAGDLLYCLYAADGASGPATPSAIHASWTSNSLDNNVFFAPTGANLNSLYMALLWRVASGSEPSTYTFPIGSGANAFTHVLAISGAWTPSNPWDVTETLGNSVSDSTSHVAPTITPALPGDLEICHFLCAPSLNSTTAYTAPSGMTAQLQGADNPTTNPYYYTMCVTTPLVTATATGTKTANFISAQQWWTANVVIKAASIAKNTNMRVVRTPQAVQRAIFY